MVEALDFDKMKKEIADRDYYCKEQLVCVLMARYSISEIEKVINDNYFYWDRNSGKGLDIYLPGYGEYICPDVLKKGQIILKFDSNDTRVYFDGEAFILFKDELSNKIEKFKYKDRMQMLIFNCNDNRLDFKDVVEIDFSVDSKKYGFENINEFMEEIVIYAKKYTKTKELVDELRKKRIKYLILNNTSKVVGAIGKAVVSAIKGSVI
ncbi:hypothetical protein B0P06_004848 [Clostridium saccharoperbutylacetonicum]|uniref:Uncharacterized protein n=1 Tax=Clostridium saccharoperbutylacetonicum N1-4(HMT) TaxID=931276 RepID=M1MQ58_9CLOT|nr:hypothetical protein [Clostridium saccharoperbutylacetonicum]AGF56871.1 hypothetical protein Cspa_c31100 [Clostridium saccharoperbutylacetonicum N1-4(HMT)]NRT62371.1 hypothetical protein [Clostridium saccharoperbutylacetonicum]NSB25708.1 hypothetical protein [Clostridium saccharoperbutylacetonicum]NSB45077.1 hypothetical protein [Clostridium saccharoperbutylacetonicum]